MIIQTCFVGLLVICLLGCSALPNSNSVPLMPSPIMLGDDQFRNERAREIVSFLRANYGSAIATSIGAMGLKEYNEKEIVKSFGKRAGVPFSESRPEIVVYFSLEDAPSALTGPKIKNFRLSALLVFPQSLNLGNEVIMESSVLGRCYYKRNIVEKQQCKYMIPRAMKKALYDLSPTQADNYE